ncbi:MAG: hypothetical protein HYT75_05875 [Deltaproteobacteria bacterium]|nr:hypothetical protein [Deltaproteobacteria bacterium]
MANGISRYALIIYGSAEQTIQEEVEQSLAFFNENGFETFVTSRIPPDGPFDHYITASVENVEKLVGTLREKIDDNDELVIYTTGHGRESNGAGTLCFEGDCDHERIHEIFSSIVYGKRSVFMAQCYGGNWKKDFSNDPNTLFISTGGKGKSVKCGRGGFFWFFWSKDAPDYNHDGGVSFEERRKYALHSLSFAKLLK